MVKLSKKYIVSFLVVIIMFTSLALPAEAFSFNINPFAILQKTSDIIVVRVSNLIDYFVAQKQNIFANFFAHLIFNNPVNIPVNFEVIPSSTSSTILTTSGVTYGRLVTIGTSTLPDVVNTSPMPANTYGDQSFSPIPGLIVEPDSNSSREQVYDYSNGSQILRYTNIERENMSLEPLIANNTLNIIADLRADDLFANQYFEHDSPDGKSVTDLAKKFGYNYLLIGENLAQGSFDGEQGIVSAWMESAGHRANILNKKYKELGVSVKTGIFKGDNTTIAVQIFALPLANCPNPNQEIKAIIDSSTISIKQMQTEAQVLYINLNIIKNNSETNSSYYNQKAQEYNSFAKRINDAILALKRMIDFYNIEVSQYNSCINP